MSWLLVICKRCAGKISFLTFSLFSPRCLAVHQRLTSDFLRIQSLIATSCDPDLIDLLREFGNEYSNDLLEAKLSDGIKPTYESSLDDREQYIRKKYLEKSFLRPLLHPKSHQPLNQDELNRNLYENVETADWKKTLHLLMLGANPNYSEKMFAVADHAKRHQQFKQMKLILANGGREGSVEFYSLVSVEEEGVVKHRSFFFFHRSNEEKRHESTEPNN